MARPYPIVGAEGRGCHPRLELRDLQTRPVQFSLFIRALRKLLDMNNTKDEHSADYFNKPNSWWQIGAIHGLPYTPWSGDPNGPQKADPNASYQGYCYHGSALFPTWHRVSVLLVEQAITNEAMAIACELEERDCCARDEKWMRAAEELRLPFWDWTRLETAEEGIPRIFQEPVVTIVNPGGSCCEVPNPLNHYKYAAKPGMLKGIEYMGDWTRTYRWADREVDPTKEMYDQALNAFAQGGKLSLGREDVDLHPVTWLREKVAALFTYRLTLEDPAFGPNMWGYFSNTNAADNGVEPPMAIMPASIEESHNTIHVDVGGIGSMSFNEYASFDPIFFLHHCNVDRIYAFWEYLYPEYWIGDGWKNSKTGQTTSFITDKGTFWQDTNATVNHATPLIPFRNECLNYWTSDDVRGLLSTSPVDKYYTYPPITDPRTGIKVQVDVPYDAKDLSLREEYQQALLYEWGRDLHSLVQTHLNLSTTLPFFDLLFKRENGISHLRQFIIIGRLPEFAFPGSYRLELYVLPKTVQQTPEIVQRVSPLGISQQAPQALQDATVHVVNNITVLGRADPDRCNACRDRRAAGSCIRGYMHLDPRVILCLLSSLDATQLASITELDHLTLLIQASFGMRLVRPDGTKLAAADPDTPAHCLPLEEAKLPKLSLHSHLIKFDHTDPVSHVKFGEYVTHGTFEMTHGWKAF